MKKDTVQVINAFSKDYQPVVRMRDPHKIRTRVKPNIPFYLKTIAPQEIPSADKYRKMSRASI